MRWRGSENNYWEESGRRKKIRKLQTARGKRPRERERERERKEKKNRRLKEKN